MTALNRIGLIVVTAAAIAGVGAVARPVDAQVAPRVERAPNGFGMLPGSGAEIGVTVRDLDTREQRGAAIDQVRPGSPAERAGLRVGDVVVDFDGERVRSARQFARLVVETVPGSTVKATVVRAGQRRDVQITPEQGPGADAWIYGPRMRERLDQMFERMPEVLPDFEGLPPRHALGATVQQLTPQLGEFFGASHGLLVTAVADGSAAARAGLKAGDVLMTLNGSAVDSRADLLRLLRQLDATSGVANVTLGIVRDRKEQTLTATLEPRDARGRTGRTPA